MTKIKLVNFVSPKEIVNAARTCYSSKSTSDKSDENLLRHLIKNNESPLEFANFTIYIEGISRIATHQLVRHRIASYAQKSQIYCRESDAEFYIPASISKDIILNSQYCELNEKLLAFYNELKKLGIPNNDARYILPSSTYSNIMVHMNAKSLLHFLYLRLIDEKQASELITIARKIKDLIKEHSDDWGKFLIETWEELNEIQT